jgi:hypothetical protein
MRITASARMHEPAIMPLKRRKCHGACIHQSYVFPLITRYDRFGKAHDSWIKYSNGLAAWRADRAIDP